MFLGIIFGISAMLVLFAFIFFRKERKKYFYLTLKIMVLFYMALAFFRYLLSDGFIWVINKGYYGGVYYEKTDLVQSVLRWGHYTSYSVLAMAVFFKSRLFKNIAIFVCLPFAIASVFHFDTFMTYFMDTTGRGYHLSETIRQIQFCTELIFAIAIPLLLIVVDKHFFNFKSKTEWKNFFIALPFIILLLIPAYVPQSILGYTNIDVSALTVGNAAWFLVTILEIFVLFKIFRFKSYAERYKLCMFLAIALFMHYNSTYLMGFSITRLPLQLCNLAVYFFVIALLIKKEKFFNFVFMANIVGTLIAMFSPDTSGGIAGFWNMHFMIEHMQVLVIPMLCMLLRIFPRPGKKALRHLAVGFSCYFGFCFILGTILNGYAGPTTYDKVNYFYIFDVEKVSELISFLPFNKTGSWTLFNRFTIYPLFQSFVFMFFLGLCLLFYLFLMKFYDFLDDQFELRKAKIDIYEKLTGKKYPNPRTYEEVDEKMIIEDEKNA